MVAFILSWAVIFIVLFCFGDMLIVLYNRACGRNEKYSCLDTLLLGMSFLIIPLSVWSFWLPSNHYFLAVSVAASLLYCAISRKRMRLAFSRIKTGIGALRTWPIILITLCILLCLSAWIWEGYVYDSLYYQQQAIRWNEEYRIIPGLGNLGDRLAFNSNYLLLSSIFTFRFLFGEPVYSLQGLFATCLIAWTLIDLFRSGYESKRLLVFASLALFYALSVFFLQNTSTDLLPNLIIFYLVAKYMYDPDLFNKNYLLAVVLVFIITLKLSFSAFLLLPLYVAYRIWKEKKYSAIVFCLTISLFIVAAWVARNVIVSGYAVYPVYQIDLFSFDWKIPEEIAIAQDNYITKFGRIYLKNLVYRYPDFNRDPLPIIYLTFFMYLLLFLSATALACKLVKGKALWTKLLNPVFTALIITLLLWFVKGPDARFVHGTICAAIMYGFSLLIPADTKLPRWGKGTLGLVILAFAVWSVVFFAQHYKEVITESKSKTKYKLSEILYKPCPFRSTMAARGMETPLFQPYYLGDSILIHLHSQNLVLDDIPSAMDFDYTKGRFIDYTKLENRGKRIEDGFRLRE
ncbi:MAG: hypothetical protein LBR34_10280 [Prevotella sp.]|jgi:hypothetical protein|nr:hypothetical protein [Prevotella sp.]